jgi:hypothetical protein
MSTEYSYTKYYLWLPVPKEQGSFLESYGRAEHVCPSESVMHGKVAPLLN